MKHIKLFENYSKFNIKVIDYNAIYDNSIDYLFTYLDCRIHFTVKNTELEVEMGYIETDTKGLGTGNEALYEFIEYIKQEYPHFNSILLYAENEDERLMNWYRRIGFNDIGGGVMAMDI
jgi:ribosomal protein S18 acetylase RimI-like enzyme